MARKFLKRYTPDPEKIKSNKSFRFMGTLLHDPNLFHINRRSASLAFFVGLFVAFLPIPSQMIVAALLAILLRCNLPISILLVWVTNPVTMPAIFYGSYKVGALILHIPTEDFAFELSFKWLIEEIAKVWQPLLLGSVICGLISGAIGYVVVRATWRFHVITRWQNRKKRR